MARFALVFFFAVSACSSDDGSGTDGGAPIDGDGATPVDCTPTGSPDAYRCPTGCIAVEGNRVDVDADCVTSEPLVLACFPEDAEAMGDGAVQCLRDPETGLVVRSPSMTIQVSGETDDLLQDTGWIRCDEPIVSPCP